MNLIKKKKKEHLYQVVLGAHLYPSMGEVEAGWAKAWGQPDPRSETVSQDNMSRVSLNETLVLTSYRPQSLGEEDCSRHWLEEGPQDCTNRDSASLCLTQPLELGKNGEVRQQANKEVIVLYASLWAPWQRITRMGWLGTAGRDRPTVYTSWSG